MRIKILRAIEESRVDVWVINERPFGGTDVFLGCFNKISGDV